MCMKGTKESCYLVERMAKVEVRQNMILLMMVVVLMFLGYLTVKLMNTQIYLLTGERGLTSISTASHGDVETLREAVNNNQQKKKGEQ